MTKREKLISLSYELDGDWLRMYHILQKDPQLKQWAPKVKPAVKALTIYDEAYPKALLELKRPPFVLYYEGDLSLLEAPVTAIMGNLAPTDYGRAFAQKLAVCGPVAAVVDFGVAEKALMASKGPIGILACGLRMGKKIFEGGLLLSEHPPHVPFSWRNYSRACQFLLDLGEALFVFELEGEDPRLGMISSCLRGGFPVFVLPDRMDGPKSLGGLALLEKGALAMDFTFFQNK